MEPRGFAWTGSEAHKSLILCDVAGAESASNTILLSCFVLFGISQAGPEMVGWMVG